MSKSEQQRVAIARALVHEPALLLADEPTGNLDEETAKQVLPVLVSLTRARGATLLIITHDTALARSVDEVLELRDGRLQRHTAARRLRLRCAAPVAACRGARNCDADTLGGEFSTSAAASGATSALALVGLLSGSRHYQCGTTLRRPARGGRLSFPWTPLTVRRLIRSSAGRRGSMSGCMPILERAIGARGCCRRRSLLSSKGM